MVLPAGGAAAREAAPVLDSGRCPPGDEPAILMGMAQLQPGPHLYFDGIGNKPVPVLLREVDKHTLGVFYEGRDDYDLAEEVSGRFEPDTARERPTPLW